MSKVPNPVIADRSAGAVIASACGDALGAPHEFKPPLHKSVSLEMTGGGSYGWQPGEWTDDTQMALALLTPLASGNRDVSGVEEGFLHWYRSDPADVGGQTSSILSRGGPLAEAAARYLAHNPNGAGNGGLMRIAPAGLSFPGDQQSIAAYAEHTTALTHTRVDCLDASVLWAVAIDQTIHHAPASQQPWDFARAVRHGLKFLPQERQSRWDQLITEAADTPAVEFRKNGWVVHAFQAALASIIQTPVPTGDRACEHLVNAIETAVRCGSDTDTVAAIAGALLGARWGETAIPLRWRAVLHGKRVYGEPELTVKDLEVLARRATKGGRGDDVDWPGCAKLVPHYLKSGSNDHTTYVDIEGVHFGNVAGLAPALNAGADVVISLCRMGTEDVPKDREHVVIGLIDTVAEDNPNLAFVLADTVDVVAAHVDKGRKVYVHCVGAQNRTPAVAATYLVRHHGKSVEDALEEVYRGLRSQPQPFLSRAIGGAAAYGG
jgi:ADP-ribosyl-[dinitrogen reductase] hydrolase